LVILVLSAIIEKGRSITYIPVTYYSNGQLSLSTNLNSITYAKFTQCVNSTAGLSNLQISIIQPTNPTFSIKQAYAVMEVSTCSNSFAQNCIIATNYYLNMNDGNTYAYDNITIPFDISQSTLYFRFLAKVSGVNIAIHMTYSDEPVFSGVYSYYVFATSNGNTNNNWFPAFQQLVKTDQVQTVQNGNDDLFFVEFCTADISNQEFQISIFVLSDPSTPLAAFDVAGCSAEQSSTVLCKVTNGGFPGVIADQSATSAIYVTMVNGPSLPLEQGIYVDVFGVGGDLQSNNNYFLTITLS